MMANLTNMLRSMLFAAASMFSGYANAQEFSFRLYSSADGLPAQDVHFLMEDSQGFL